ncbi:MAG: DNA repair protein [Waddliaceae bacterium]|jgi:ABC-type glutathione transport system ATPase component|nr:DNA repair protein [Waddliaceae bacterium]MBT3579406.1 DNA repair protein [Waddliaceae bacterium]MBT4444626.1 DNA repair protein [Waddliaceae bacterium]MBT6928756.1 DNA repair protein [Waddliaceae bacterium]MBT7264224.1 DNA repair protein [Waddliaceae bacterium]
MITSPQRLRTRIDMLKAYRTKDTETRDKAQRNLEGIKKYLEISEDVTATLETLSDKLFETTVKILEDKLTIALQEILEQPITLKTERSLKRNIPSLEFFVEREGRREDIMKGQGGSVANILSVGLRMLALTTLDPKKHRRFLVLDEQDCWLQPELVPRLVKIVQQAGKELGFQVVMISHHDVSAFEQHADRIYTMTPSPEGVIIKQNDEFHYKEIAEKE